MDEDGSSLTQQPHAPLHDIVAKQEEVETREAGHPVAMQAHEGCFSAPNATCTNIGVTF